MKKEQGHGPLLNCYDGYLYTQAITVSTPGGTRDAIGHMVVCARRFQREKPSHIEDYIQALTYRLPECGACCRELTSFRKSITVDFKKTPITRPKMREILSTRIREGCRDFWLNSGIKSNTPPAPMPGIPLFGGEYNPDAYIEPQEEPL